MKKCTYKSCINCMLAGYCIHLNAKVVNEHDMANWDFVRDALAFGYSLNFKPAEFTLGIQLDCKEPTEWTKFIDKAYTEYRGRFIGRNGQEEFLNMELFEVPDKKFGASKEELSNAFDNLCEWNEYWFCTPHTEQKHFQFRGDTREKLRIAFTVLRATYPQEETKFWGLRAANDNNPQ